MPSCQVTIINKLGLHARAAAKFVSVANTFPCQISIGRDANNLCNGKNIMSVMMLAASKGTALSISAEGEDAEAALVALQALIAERFHEES
ncbi:HPr family phosphocarrier protein [Denitrificimonas caeni]|uniref:HPr family phosphocarrier protein n=1 Tax=Denitrificimonas caeni TaxID=521720 RepID=UPI0019627B57|nr:HPr family phosphocarrier protein [Denitrificimonas caeni]